MMFHDVSWCFMMFHDVSWCFMMFHDFSWCFMMFHDVSWCFMMFHDVSWCFMVSWKVWPSFLWHQTPPAMISSLPPDTLLSFKDRQITCWLNPLLPRIEKHLVPLAHLWSWMAHWCFFWPHEPGDGSWKTSEKWNKMTIRCNVNLDARQLPVSAIVRQFLQRFLALICFGSPGKRHWV